jgi:hypothetical protein
MSSTTMTTEIRRIRCSYSYTQVWLRRWSLRLIILYAYSDDCVWRRSLHPPMRYVYSDADLCAFPLVYVYLGVLPSIVISCKLVIPRCMNCDINWIMIMWQLGLPGLSHYDVICGFPFEEIMDHFTLLVAHPLPPHLLVMVPLVMPHW